MSRLRCPHCDRLIESYPFPLLTVDCIVRDPGGRLLLVERRFPPPGWALPGGFVDSGESLETAVRREVLEETGLTLSNLCQMHAYSDPARDKRHHTVSVVFTAQATGTPQAGDDAGDARFFSLEDLPSRPAFDHGKILQDYLDRLAAQ